jgi:hypothetical protein
MRGKNNLDYQFGDRKLLNAGFRFSPTASAVLSVQLNGQGSAHDSYRSDLVPSTGSRQVTLTPGVTLFNASGVGLYVFLPFPIYQDVNDVQLASRMGLMVGLSATF